MAGKPTQFEKVAGYFAGAGILIFIFFLAAAVGAGTATLQIPALIGLLIYARYFYTVTILGESTGPNAPALKWQYWPHLVITLVVVQVCLQALVLLV